jgi:uncharacterized protein
MSKEQSPDPKEIFSEKKIISDLLWALNSPEILSTTSIHNYPLVPTAVLHAMAKKARWIFKNHPEKITQFCETFNEISPKKLGYYFEALIGTWLNMDQDFQLEAQNLVISEDKITLGEIDFLLINNIDKTHYHWESAIKFYLYDSESKQYIGPGGIDRLDLKVTKLFDHQLKLTQHEAFKNHKLGLKDVEYTPQCLLKGKLFYRPEDIESTLENTIGLNKNHLTGLWLYNRDVDSYFASAHGRWVILPSFYWLSEASILWHELDPLETDSVIGHIKKHFKFEKKPLSLAYFENKLNNGWQLIQQTFIVHDDWPNLKY